MKVAVFLLTLFALSKANSLPKDTKLSNESPIIRPIYLRPPFKVSKSNQNEIVKFNGELKLVPNCGVTAVNDQSSKIYGGVDATPNALPWQCLVFIQNNDGFFFGGGSLINEDWVLTAGHLTYGAFAGHVELGSTHRSEMDPDQINIDINQIITHPQYEGVDHNDLGLVSLVTSAPYTVAIRPICLPSYSDFVGGGVSLLISGWGGASFGSPDNLQVATVTSMTTTACAAILDNIDDTKICTVGSPGVGTCSGDSGGPLMLVSGGVTYSTGITSFVVGDCGGSFPDGFTRTSAYLDWISLITGIAIDP